MSNVRFEYSGDDDGDAVEVNDDTIAEDEFSEDDITGDDAVEEQSESTDEGSYDETPSDTDALLSRLRVIEDQPLESRAQAFTQLHDQLQSRLEGHDA